MKIHVFDDKMNQLGFIQSYTYLDWHERFNDPGGFTLIVVNDDFKKNVSLLKDNYYLYMTDRKTAMQIERVEYNSIDKTITANGHTILNRLRHRVINGTFKISNAEVGLRTIYANNRRNLSIDLGELKGFTEQVESQHSNKEILEMFIEVCTEAGFGVQVLFDHKFERQRIDIYKGVDRTNEITKSDRWGGLNDAVLTIDSSIFKNVAYVWGEGEGFDRMLSIVGSAYGDDRRELAVDARDLQRGELDEIQYVLLLRARGVAALNEHLKTTNFSQEIDVSDFGVSFDLGDTITIAHFEYGVFGTVKATEFNRVSENNKLTTKVIFSEPQLRILEGNI